MNKIVLSSLIVLGLSSAALAQAATDFATVDADVSGGLSWTEVQAAWPDLTEDDFTAADTDADGELNEDEYTALTAGTADTETPM
jgi:hypothetical protein